ncbi:MAG: glycosyltransferase family 2 protein [Planctomycetes bacterium]|nr:glycosyltransferase family 2 protein [Planctomycetota bacterium]
MIPSLSDPTATGIPVVVHSAATPDCAATVSSVLDELDRLVGLLGCERPVAVTETPYPVPAGFKLSIVVPVYNEAATIRTIIGRVIGVPLPKEVIIVDDCSTDGTREILQSLESSPLFTVFYKPVNQGKGAALRTGFSLASGDVIVVQDADLEYDPQDIPAVVKPLVENASDVVFGSRFLGDEPQDKSLTHRLGNQFLTLASNLFTGLPITDMETCYKAFRRSALDGIVLKQNRFGFEPEITAKLSRRNLRITEVPIRYQARGYAEGKKIGLRDLFNALWCIVRYGIAD